MSEDPRFTGPGMALNCLSMGIATLAAFILYPAFPRYSSVWQVTVFVLYFGVFQVGLSKRKKEMREEVAEIITAQNVADIRWLVEACWVSDDGVRSSAIAGLKIMLPQGTESELTSFNPYQRECMNRILKLSVNPFQPAWYEDDLVILFMRFLERAHDTKALAQIKEIAKSGSSNRVQTEAHSYLNSLTTQTELTDLHPDPGP